VKKVKKKLVELFRKLWMTKTFNNRKERRSNYAGV